MSGAISRIAAERGLSLSHSVSQGSATARSTATIKVLGKGAVGYCPKVAAPGYIVLLPQGRPQHNDLQNQQQGCYYYQARVYDAYLLFFDKQLCLSLGNRIPFILTVGSLHWPRVFFCFSAEVRPVLRSLTCPSQKAGRSHCNRLRKKRTRGSSGTAGPALQRPETGLISLCVLPPRNHHMLRHPSLVMKICSETVSPMPSSKYPQ